MRYVMILPLVAFVLGISANHVKAQSHSAAQPQDGAGVQLDRADNLRLDLIADTGDDVVPGTWILAFRRNAGEPIGEGGLGYGYDANGFVRVPEDLPDDISEIRPLEMPNVLLYAEESRQTTTSKKYQPLLPNTFLIKIEGDEKAVVKALRGRFDVRYVEPERERTPALCWGTDTPDDPLLEFQWGMQIIGAPTAWALMSPTISDVRLAVCESGRVSTTHVDLVAQRVLAGDRNTNAVGDHATHVAGIAAATGDNGEGVAGVANVELVSFDPESYGSGFAYQIALAVNDGVDAFNMSWHWYVIPDETDYAPYSQTEQDAINAAAGDMLFVAAAGNDDTDQDADGDYPYPAAYTNVLGVSATDPDDQKAYYSNFGPYVDLAAPGGEYPPVEDEIISTVDPNDPPDDYLYAYKQGTSMAAPHVTGAGAAVMVVRELSPRATANILRMTAADLGSGSWDEVYGYGRLNLAAAVTFPDSDCYVSSELGSDAWFAGGLGLPYRTVGYGIDEMPDHGTLGIARGNYPENLTISKPCTLRCLGGGDVTIGQ